MNSSNKAQRKFVKVDQFGLHLGSQTHFIKVFKEHNKDNLIYIKSNKSVNVLRIAIEKLLTQDMIKEGITSFNTKQYIHNRLINLLAFNSVRKQLVLYSKKTKSQASSNNLH